MAIDDQPVAIFNRQLENDELLKPVGASTIESAAKIAGAVTQSPALKIFEPISKALDLVSKCLSLGVPTVEDNLKLLGQLVEDGLLRHEEKIATVSGELDRFRATIKSEAFTEYLATAVLHTQRTSREARLKRLANIVVNGVREDDLDSESGDDMMRAAVELSESDISLLKRIYEIQAYMIRDPKSTDGDRLGRIAQDWTARTKLPAKNGGIDLAKCRGSIVRLQAQAFVQLRTPGFDAGEEIVVLLPDGAIFYERLQEIGAAK